MNDTHPEAEAVLIGLIRQATVAERLERVWSLSRTITNLSRRAIAEARPQLRGEELRLELVRRQYGDEMARQLRSYLSERSPCPTVNS